MTAPFLHVHAVKLVPLALLTVLLAVGCNEARQSTATPPQTSAVPAVQAETMGYLPHAQPRLQTMKLFVGMHEVTAELALKPVEIMTGMMWRTNMPDGEAMLFVFGNADQRSFYMKNTIVPLSVAYIDPEGVIQEIHDLHPRVEASVPSRSENIQFVLEVPQGWFAKKQIVPGTVVRSPHGELRNTFTFGPPRR